MDNSLVVPRLRLSRHQTRARLDNVFEMPQAGPSRISTYADALDATDDEDDNQSTPKVASKPQLESIAGGPPPESSVHRLRTALSLNPSHSSRFVPRRPPSPAYSEMESDFEPPNMTTNATEASIAKESLRELFSRAFVDTPQKPKLQRARRNSDTSEVESSPRVQLVERERAKNKGKRKSLSDEEAEKSTIGAVNVIHKSSAMAYESLRQRLASAVGRSSTSSSFAQSYPVQDPSETNTAQDIESTIERSGDTAIALRNLQPEGMSFDPPDATSTPLHSLRMPSELQLQSNLLSQDSEMQNAMRELDTFDGDTTVNRTRRRYPFPPSRPTGLTEAEPPESSSRAHSKSHSTHNLPLGRRVSLDSTSSRRSSLSAADFREFDNDKLHERERAWNKPTSRPPSLHTTPEANRHYSTGSPSFNTTIMPGNGSPRGLSRRGSITSMHSFDGRSSVGSSVGSRSDLRDRIREMDDERNKERERQWNRTQSGLSRSTSSLSFHSPQERHRAGSIPHRPESAQSFTTPPRPSTSWRSVSLHSSRASSPASSIASLGREPNSEPRNPVSRERERNWNSPNAKWEHQPPPRSISPLPRLTHQTSHSHSRLSNGSPSNSLLEEKRSITSRTRTVSLGSQPARPRSPLVRLSAQGKIPRPESPSPPAARDSEGSPKATSFGSRFGWSLPKNRSSLPPLDFGDSPQHRIPTPPGSRPPSRLSTTPSRIPVRSPRKDDPLPDRRVSSSASFNSEEPGHHEGMDSSDEIYGTPNVTAPRIRIEPVDLIHEESEDIVPTDIETESDLESQVTSTPLARPSTILEESENADEPLSPSSPPSMSVELLHKAPPLLETLAKPSPPPSSPPRRFPDAGPTSPLFGLRTPPRRPHFNTSKAEFQTPSPPHNMPDLPGPPSSSEEEADLEQTPAQHGGFLGNFSTMKTPKPPGAWALTPVPVEKPEAPPVEPAPLAALSQMQDVTPDGTALGLTTNKTPAPPGGWQATPAAAESLRRKSILKVRFDVESNTSADTTLDEVPVVGPANPPSTPGDSISEVFPLVNAGLIADKVKTEAKQVNGELAPERASTPPPTLRTRAARSPGVRVLDAFGRETSGDASPVLEPPPPAGTSETTGADKTSGTTTAVQASPRNRSAMRIVDAMGREVESEMSAAEDLVGPTSHKDAVRRIRALVAGMEEDFGESDDSRALIAKDDQRLNDLYRTSQTARSTRKGLSETIQKHKDQDAELRAKYGSLRESMQRTKLLPPANTERSPRFTINFLNAWVLWAFLILQICLLIYMYQLSILRARHIFLTTYYDPFEPALFAHIPRSDALERATPSPSSVPFSVAETLSRGGWKGLLTQAWSHIVDMAHDWHKQIWDSWRQNARTTAWPPT